MSGSFCNERVALAESAIERTIEVPTEDGRVVVIRMERGYWTGAWTVHISDELVAMQPQAVHAVFGQAIMQMRELTDQGGN